MAGYGRRMGRGGDWICLGTSYLDWPHLVGVDLVGAGDTCSLAGAIISPTVWNISDMNPRSVHNSNLLMGSSKMSWSRVKFIILNNVISSYKVSDMEHSCSLTVLGVALIWLLYTCSK